jgi:predicted DNA-binding transcriptional regulator AlpA
VKIDEDKEEIFGNLRASKSDVLLYKYFIRKAMVAEFPREILGAAARYRKEDIDAWMKGEKRIKRVNREKGKVEISDSNLYIRGGISTRT